MNSRPQKRTVLAAALAVAALLVAVASLAAAAPAPAPRAGGPPACRTSDLTIWLANPKGNGTAGSVYYKLNFTNLSGHTCTVNGFPVVVAVNLKGKKLGFPAGRETSKAAKPVKLRNGETASATLRVVEPGVFSPSECHPTIAAGVGVTPPEQSGRRTVPFPVETCAKQPSEPQLTVGPIA